MKSRNHNQICVMCFPAVAAVHVKFSRTDSLHVLFISGPKSLCCQLACLEYVLVFLSFFLKLVPKCEMVVYFHLWDLLQPTISIRNVSLLCFFHTYHIKSYIHLQATVKAKVEIQDINAVLLSAFPAKCVPLHGYEMDSQSYTTNADQGWRKNGH